VGRRLTSRDTHRGRNAAERNADLGVGLDSPLPLDPGWADPLISPEGTINYVRDAVAANGGRAATEDWLRLFLLPGVHHCSGGPGEDTVAWLSTIQRWVEDGVAPDQVVARKQDSSGQVISSRVVEQYDTF
jgi:feruloyl esterase